MSRPPCLAQSNKPGRDIVSMSLHRFHVATSWRPSHVTTSHWCRDTVSLAQPQARSRHQNQVATSWTTTYVATSFSCLYLTHCRTCRDIKFMSRLQFPTGQVATSVSCRDLLETNLCRDINFMSRHRFCPQWAFQVATPKSMSRPPTLSPMSRHQIHVATPFLLNKKRPGRDFTSLSRPPLLPATSRPQNDVATSSRLSRLPTLSPF